jgi:hypothetical protein
MPHWGAEHADHDQSFVSNPWHVQEDVMVEITHATHRVSSAPAVTRSLAGFLAGFASVLMFHQGMLTLLHAVGLTSTMPFALDPAPPFGVPQIWSLAFWGGVWGIIFAWIIRTLPSGRMYWLDSIIFGAVLPSLAAWLIVLPLKGLPVGGGWQPAGIATALLVNGAWGFGTALLLWFGAERVDYFGAPLRQRRT